MAKKIAAYLAFFLPLLLTAQNLGDYFFDKELYFEAVTEYKRQLYFNEADSEDELLLKTGQACYLAGQKQLAEEPLIDAITNRKATGFDRECLILLARIHWDNFDYEAMREVLNMLSSQSDLRQQNQIEYIKAWTHIYQAHWQEAIAGLKKVTFIDTAALIGDIRNAAKVPQKSKKTAALISNIIPGSGQLYAGDYKNAAYSFLLVGSLTGSIIRNICEKAYFVAATKYLFLYSRYHKGGMKNLARQIDRDNVDRIGYYLKDIAEKYPSPLALLKQLQVHNPGGTVIIP